MSLGSSLSNRRQSNRVPSNLRSQFAAVVGDLRSACVRNISRGGALLESPDPPAVGDVITLENQDREPIIGNVIHVRRDPSGSYLFGIRFYEKSREHPDADCSRQMLSSRQINERAFRYYKRLQRLQNFVEQNLSDDVPLGRAARVAAMERTYFSSFFHKKVGVGFHEWLQYLRVREAMRRIQTENCTITMVALESGFSDLRTFERAFKKWTSMTPRDFKKMVMP